uniref:Uncharacterized protein n=1 Tax=Schistocephalus solidus TaxID=70667 RepID=A0A0X3PF75_SCHSO
MKCSACVGKKLANTSYSSGKIMRRLSSNACTLLGGASNTPTVTAMGSGEYVQLGFVRQLTEHVLISSKDITGNEVVAYLVIDRLQMKKKTKREFRPILGRSMQSLAGEIFVIGIYCGHSKPLDGQSFCKPLTEKLISLAMSVLCPSNRPDGVVQFDYCNF